MKFFKKRKVLMVYLVILGILVVGSYALLLIPDKKTLENISQIILQRSRITSSQLPIVDSEASFPVLSAQGAIAVDLDSAVVLYEKNPTLQLLPASTTKILTALVSLEHYSADQVLTVGKITVIGQKMNLVSGEKITAQSLLEGLLIYSANDAAEVLADNFPGGREAFIIAMNQKAEELSLTSSHFMNPTGLDAINHYSSARDMIRLSEVAMRNSNFATIVGTKTKTVKSADERFVHNLKNINELLGTVEGVKGVKTGWTEGARENLVTYVERDGKRILLAVLGSQDRFGESKELINWIFSQYSWKDVVAQH